MDLGKISEQLRLANQDSSGEIHVHLTNARFEKSVGASAQLTFREYRLFQTARKNAILIYMNTLKKEFSLVFDEEFQKKIGTDQCQKFSKYFSEDLKMTHSENALIQLIRNLGFILKKEFPLETTSDTQLTE